MATLWTLGCDAADPRRLATFWALALGYVAEPGDDDEDGASIVDPAGDGPAIGFLGYPRARPPRIGARRHPGGGQAAVGHDRA